MRTFVILHCMLLWLHMCCCQPTTPHIQEIFMGKCFEKNPGWDPIPNSLPGVNCSLLWQTFAMGAEKDMHVVTDNDFKPFFSVAPFGSPKDNALFWSGNKNFANRLAADGTRFTTLEETSTGYILNGLSWCGKLLENGTEPAFDYHNSCDYAQNSTYYGSQGVWNSCSKAFASSVTGDINILLQPQQLYYTSGPYLAYRNTSIFKLIELPSMNSQAISNIRILLLINTTSAPLERCGSGSLKDLSDEILAKFHFAPTCVDDPEQIIDILCDGGQENTPECTAAYMNAHQESRSILVWAIIGTCMSAVLLVAVIVLVFNIAKMRKQLQYMPIR